MVTVTINLQTVTMEEVQALQAMLTAYDRAAIGSQIKAGQFNEETIEEAAIRAAQNRDAIRRPIPSQLPVAIPVATPAEEEALDVVEVKQEEKPKRGRPRKNEVAAEPVDPSQDSPVTSAVSTDSPSQVSTDSAPASAAPTPDQLTAALKAMRTRLGDIQPCIDLLAEFECARIGDVAGLPAAKQIEFLGRCNA